MNWDIMAKNQISLNLRLIENNKGLGKVVISKDPEQKLDNFLAGFCHKFNSGKKYMFQSDIASIFRRC